MFIPAFQFEGAGFGTGGGDQGEHGAGDHGGKDKDTELRESHRYGLLTQEE